MKKYAWTLSAVTDQGLQRQDNQDNYYITPDERILVVADGMGGAAHGALASKLAVQAIEKKWTSEKPEYGNEAQTKEWLQSAVEKANQAVMQLPHEGRCGPGTTIVVAIQSNGGKLLLAHVGDSRAYRFRQNTAERLTRDHSFVMEMMLNNQLTEEQAWNNPYRNLLTRCLGHDANVTIEHSEAELQDGDLVLLCSDGLSGVLRDSRIAEIVDESESTDEICTRLVDEVLQNKAPDNVTIIALRVSEIKKETSKRETASNGVH